MKVAKQIYPLTSLRFFAAILVVLHHTVDHIWPAAMQPAWTSRLQEYTGSTVLLFFILSGYVLAVVYLEPGERIGRTSFWWARFARIYPLYLAALVLDAPNLFHLRLLRYGMRAATLKTAVSFAGSALLLQQWFPRLKGIDFPNWSLSVEALFYLLFPLYGMAFWRLRLSRQLVVTGAVFAGFWIAQYIAMVRNLDLFAHTQPLTYLPHFIAGIALRRVHIWISEDVRRLALCRSFAPWGAVLAAGSLVVACSVPRHVSTWILPELVMLPAYSLLLLCFAVGNRSMDRFFSRPALVVLGEASYALYLLHVIVWTWLFQYLSLPVNLATYTMYVGAAVLLSVVSLKYLEKPARRFILNRTGQKMRETEPAAALAQ